MSQAVVFCRPDTKMASPALTSNTEPWKELKSHVEEIKKTHLRDLMSDIGRCKSMTIEYNGLLLDYSRQCATQETMKKLFKLAEAAHLKEKINCMFSGERINSTENRSVLHVALRAPRDAVINSDGKNIVPDVWKVLDKINEFAEKVRNGSWVGATGKALKDVIAVGIGGSFLGPLFVHTALQTASTGQMIGMDLGNSKPYEIAFPAHAYLNQLSYIIFLANVDPIDVARSITGLNPETTLVVIVSKTFTTAETMLNARTLREWITSALGPGAVAKHMVAVSTNLKFSVIGCLLCKFVGLSSNLVEEFGIDPNNAFAFWDWVGGRYSVCSAVGVLPLSLQYGFSIVQRFLQGASSIDGHFHSAAFEHNIPAILPYSQALEKFAPHIQQVSMESNGKGVSIDGVPLPFEAGEIDFGEPGTNGQHREIVNNHDELMSNFFAQPDALAYGKVQPVYLTPEQLKSEKVPEHLIPHKTFPGNRPSLSLLLPSLDAYNVGQLLAIYEHRVAVQGFLWGINSFDQWGVELGKKGEKIHPLQSETRWLLSLLPA
ncbi:Glucose-6-phosphate isomerase, cytosolic 1 [Asimina triloba]